MKAIEKSKDTGQEVDIFEFDEEMMGEEYGNEYGDEYGSGYGDEYGSGYGNE